MKKASIFPRTFHDLNVHELSMRSLKVYTQSYTIPSSSSSPYGENQQFEMIGLSALVCLAGMDRLKAPCVQF